MTYRTRRFLWTVAWLLALYTVVGFFVLPLLLKPQLERRASAALGRAVSIGRLRLNPWTLSATLERVNIRTADGAASFAGWDRFYVNFEAVASIEGDWTLGNVEIVNLHAAVTLDEKGAPNFADILARFAPAKEGPAPAKPAGRPWRIERLRVADSRVEFVDRSRRPEFRTTVGPIDFSLVEFRTVGAVGAPYRFEAATEAGERFSWTGTLSAAPLASNGELRIEHLALPNYAPYLADRLNAQLVSGRLSVSGNYEVRLGPENRRIALSGGSVQLRDLRLVEAGQSEPVIELPAVDVTGLAVDGRVPRITVEALTVNGGRLTARRAADGAINLLTLVSASSSAPAVPAPPPDLTAREITLHDVRVDWLDAAMPRPVELHLTGINATIGRATLAPGAPMPVDLSLGWLPQGTAHLSGVVSVAPVQADLQLEVTSLALPPLSPYLEKLIRAQLASGMLDVKGRATLSAPERAPAALTYAGAARLADVRLTGTPDGADFAGVAELAVDGAKLATAPRLAAAVDRISVREPYLHVVMRPDGQLNLSSIFASETAAATEAPPALPATAPEPLRPEISLAHVAISGGSLSFTDQSIQPAVSLTVDQFAGTLQGLASTDADAGEADLHAMINRTSPLSIKGRFNPLAAAPRADLAIVFQPVDLRAAGPYVGKYAGYELADGRLLLDTQAGLADRKLDLRNRVTLDQFTLGAPTHSPDATKLPVRLGLALLKDAKGRIVLDVPVQGSLADPDFHVDHVVSHVLVNTLTKAATSPFALLGSMFGGGGEELRQQDFFPGELTLTAESLKRLETVARALAERPALRLEVEGGYDATADVAVLRGKKLENAVRSTIWENRHARDSSTPSIDALEISDEEYAAGLRALYEEELSGNSTAATTPAAERENAGPPPAPAAEPSKQSERHRSLWRRTLDVVTLKHLRERHAERRAEKKARQEAEQEQRQQEGSSPAARTASAPSPSVDEMTSRLEATFTILPDDLQALAAARAETVREKLVADGKIAPERVAVKKDDPAAAAKLGTHVRLNLQ